jgi:hypothetical protein
MKTNKIVFLFAVSFTITTSFLYFSCKNKVDNPAAEVPIASVVVEESQATSLNDDIDNEIDNYIKALDKAGYSSKRIMYNLGDLCNPTITVDKPDLTSWPKVITLDFGTGGCTGKRGNTLKGVLQITLSGKYNTSGSYHQVKFVNFSVNNNVIKGSKKVTYGGQNEKSQDYWTIEVTDTITRENGAVTTWNSNRTRTRTGDNGTPNILFDDVYSISGTASGKNAKGETYTMTVDTNTPLVIGGVCPYIKSGKVTYTSGIYNVTVDYGSGTCDPLATATVGAITVPITLNR